MILDSQARSAHSSRWPHRLAILLCCATFPLVWVGGLVTTYKAGMAFPDWPTSDGYFLFFYPWLDWLRGPWELFVEHGHRMLAASVGLVTIALCVSLWLTQQPRWLRVLGIAALMAVIAQGLLGGARVLIDQRTLAMIHGCFGPVFFSLTALLAASTSASWNEPGAIRVLPKSFALAVATPALVYFQLVLGAQLRHFAPDGSRFAFSAMALFHALFAVALAVFIVGLSIALFRSVPLTRPVKLLAIGLPLLIVLQVLLGAATWIYKYNWPAFMANSEIASAFTVHAMGWRQAQITTAHVAVGSLILAASSVLAAFCIRLRLGSASAVSVQPDSAFRTSALFLVEVAQ